MQIPDFITDRLTVQNWQPLLRDADKRCALVQELAPLLSPSVLRHLPPPLQLAEGPGAVNSWVSDRARESDVMTLRDRRAGDLLGLLILAQVPAPDGEATPTLHIGYLLGEAAWGQGYATEMVTGLVDALRKTGAELELRAGVARDHPASARVLEKVGFTALPDQEGMDSLLFSLTL